MALFQKNPYSSTERQALYTLGQQKIVLIVGLGNPGKKYDNTRHNIGFACIDKFADALGFGLWSDKKNLKSQFTMQRHGDIQVILTKPTTFMNLSGQAVQQTANYYKIPPEQIVVVYDELDVPFGQIRMRRGGSSAGHNGIESLISHLGDNFGRVRIGIASNNQEKMDSADFVLAKFSKEETAQITSLKREVVSILTEYIYRGDLTPETRSFIV